MEYFWQILLWGGLIVYFIVQWKNTVAAKRMLAEAQAELKKEEETYAELLIRCDQLNKHETVLRWMYLVMDAVKPLAFMLVDKTEHMTPAGPASGKVLIMSSPTLYTLIQYVIDNPKLKETTLEVVLLEQEHRDNQTCDYAALIEYLRTKTEADLITIGFGENDACNIYRSIHMV